MSSDEEFDEGSDLDDLDTDETAVLPVDPVSISAYVLAFLAIGIAVMRALVEVILSNGDSAFAVAASDGGLGALASGSLGVLAVALAGLSLVRARSGVRVQEGVARTALRVGIGAVILSLVVLVLQVLAIDNSLLFNDNGSGFSTP